MIWGWRAAILCSLLTNANRSVLQTTNEQIGLTLALLTPSTTLKKKEGAISLSLLATSRDEADDPIGSFTLQFHLGYPMFFPPAQTNRSVQVLLEPPCPIRKWKRKGSRINYSNDIIIAGFVTLTWKACLTPNCLYYCPNKSFRPVVPRCSYYTNNSKLTVKKRTTRSGNG